MTFNLPVDTVTAQLASGAVKITFGELRQLVPGIFANVGGELDLRTVSLPLGEILSRLNPAMLSRRNGSKVQVGAEIAGPFGNGAAGITFTTQPMKAPAPSQPKTPPVAPTSLYTSAPATPPARLPVNPAVAPAPAARPVVPGHAAGNPPPAPRPAPLDESGPIIPRTPLPSLTPRPAAPPAPKFQAAPAPVPPPAPLPAAAPRPEPAQPAVHTTLWDLAENWPGELKQEILARSMANEDVTLAGALVVAGLKQGRIKMTWHELRTLAKPSSPPSPNDTLELELPLKVIAPLFFAAQKKAQTARKKTAVSDDIPNLFFGFPQAAPVPPTPPPPAPLPASLPPAAAPNPLDAAKKSADSNIFIWGDTSEVPSLEDTSVYAQPSVPQTDFTSRHTQPKDVISRALSLPGVAGAVVSLPDGLRVAGEVPAGMNADMLAAFIPQLFDRMNLSARELRMGALNNVGFTVGDVAWKIFRVHAVYVAIFSRPGTPLPGADLAALAAELDRKK
jgi:hypothetical protein